MVNIVNLQQKEEPHQVIKPSIKTSLLMLHSFGFAAVIFLFGGWFFLSPLLMIVSLLLGEESPGLLIFASMGLILFIIILLVVYLLKQATLKRTEYRFYSDRVEYFEGFLIKNRKTVSYDKVSNVGQRKGIIEGWFGLGTIYIDTPGSSPKGHEVSISYLENPDQVYEWVSKFVARKR
jgi:membrane protein YdbS with pleckstrin-like domain